MAGGSFPGGTGGELAVGTVLPFSQELFKLGSRVEVEGERRFRACLEVVIWAASQIGNKKNQLCHMLKFEWDENKNKSNREKHSISFEKAKEVFQYENAVEFRSDSSTELRIMRIGKTFSKILIAVVYTIRSAVIRIISARQASKKETRFYLENSLSKQSGDETQN
ncbi:MAG: BrnT family toxin [Phaeodactylibacter sp.]|nr:BrnT family toxin [Phaeodactylibacter sp.]